MTADGLNDDDIRAILKTARTFAVIGASANAERPSYGVVGFLNASGYTVHPVNPGLAGQAIHGRTVYAALANVPAPVDVVDVFRASDAALDAVRHAIAEKDRLGIKVVWMQLGVVNDVARREALAAGLMVVMDRCPKIEATRLGSV
jgi:uncharacterized protein